MLGALRSGLRRVRNSLAYRASVPYRLILESWPPRRLAAKPPLPITYLTFTGYAHLGMLRESVVSLGTWKELPKLRVVGDGSVSPARLRRTLAFWPSAPEILDWQELVEPVRARGYETVVRFAEREPMARKLLGIIVSALEGPTLYADTDVLWFRIPAELSRRASSAAPRLAMSADYRMSYDARLVPAALPHLAGEPYRCAGILLAQGDFLAACKLRELLEFAARQGVARTEQTLLAEANYQLGGDILPAGEFALHEDDRFSLAPSFDDGAPAARHYVGGVRHLFWRDALALRLGLGPKTGPRQ
jgi:hypothetical protein